MVAQGGGAAPGGFDYNQWAAMNLNRGGGGDSGEAMTPDKLIQGGLNKTIQTFVTKIVGLPVNPDIEGRGFVNAEANVGGGLSLNAMTPVKDMRGGVLAT